MTLRSVTKERRQAIRINGLEVSYTHDDDGDRDGRAAAARAIVARGGILVVWPGLGDTFIASSLIVTLQRLVESGPTVGYLVVEPDETDELLPIPFDDVPVMRRDGWLAAPCLATFANPSVLADYLTRHALHLYTSRGEALTDAFRAKQIWDEAGIEDLSELLISGDQTPAQLIATLQAARARMNTLLRTPVSGNAFLDLVDRGWQSLESSLACEGPTVIDDDVRARLEALRAALVTATI